MNATAQAEIGQTRQFISFTVGDEEYGLELLRVKEIIRVREVTGVPRAPGFVKGIVNLRGDVIPIIDLRERFQLGAANHSAATRVIVAEIGGSRVGMVVDSASQVVRIPADQIDPPPALAGEGASFITGVGKLEERLMILVDADRILGSDEIGQVHEAVQAIRA